ncbi:MAG: GNAT family N-acetyltransferase [Anaerolineae bacterium]|nr:GNAT family N-acetyltransferase [Anaerolineae bacterium]
MIVTAPSTDQSKNGPRPININTDVPGILKLLELVFGASLDSEGRHLFAGNSAALQSPAILWRLSPAAAKLSLGFVWEEDGRIVGNVTVLTSNTPGRFLVVNVAVHPDYRRRGIARLLMKQVENLVRQRQGHQILLQVVKQNSAAVELYNSLDYTTIGSITHWTASVSRLRRLELNLETPSPHIRELRRHEWRSAFALDHEALHPDLNWPELPQPDMYKNGLWARVVDFFNGRQSETWVISSTKNQLIGLAALSSEWASSHQAAIRVHPAWTGRLERPLLAKLIRRLQQQSRRNVQLDHPDDDELMNALLQEANFQPRRTLTHMRLDIKE